MNNSDSHIVLVDIQKFGQLYKILFSNDLEFRTTSGTIKNLGLTKGDAFSASEFSLLKKTLEKDFVRYSAETLLANQAYSTGEFRQRLRKKGIDSSLVTEIITEFKSFGFLDDYKFAEARARSLLARKPAGKAYLIADLQKHLVARAVAEKAVSSVLGETDEVALAVQILEKRQTALAKFDIETARRKAYTYLSRRAISYRAAKEAFDKVFAPE